MRTVVIAYGRGVTDGRNTFLCLTGVRGRFGCDFDLDDPSDVVRDADVHFVIVPPCVDETMFVPLPSLASMRASLSSICATPIARARNVTDIMLPLPLNPGFGTTPLQLTFAPETLGSCTHSVNIDPYFEMDSTLKRSIGKVSVPSLAFNA